MSYPDCRSLPDVSGKDVTLKAEVDAVEEANGDMVFELLHDWGYPELPLQLAALQLRVESLIQRTVGTDLRFELEYEKALAELLDEIILGYKEAGEYGDQNG